MGLTETLATARGSACSDSPIAAPWDRSTQTVPRCAMVGDGGRLPCTSSSICPGTHSAVSVLCALLGCSCCWALAVVHDNWAALSLRVLQTQPDAKRNVQPEDASAFQEAAEGMEAALSHGICSAKGRWGFLLSVVSVYNMQLEQWGFAAAEQKFWEG